jgi:hypothetical protein
MVRIVRFRDEQREGIEGFKTVPRIVRIRAGVLPIEA